MRRNKVYLKYATVLSFKSQTFWETSSTLHGYNLYLLKSHIFSLWVLQPGLLALF